MVKGGTGTGAGYSQRRPERRLPSSVERRTGVGDERDPSPVLHDDGGVETRLTVELVPSTCWYSNVRSHVPKAVWDGLRRQVGANPGNCCEICGGRGRRWPVECQEITEQAERIEGLEAEV